MSEFFFSKFPNPGCESVNCTHSKCQLPPLHRSDLFEDSRHYVVDYSRINSPIHIGSLLP